MTRPIANSQPPSGSERNNILHLCRRTMPLLNRMRRKEMTWRSNECLWDFLEQHFCVVSTRIPLRPLWRWVQPPRKSLLWMNPTGCKSTLQKPWRSSYTTNTFNFPVRRREVDPPTTTMCPGRVCRTPRWNKLTRTTAAATHMALTISIKTIFDDPSWLLLRP